MPIGGIVFDTSVLLNLLATGCPGAILAALSAQCIVCPVVIGESIYLRNEDPAKPYELVSLTPLLETRGLVISGLETPAEEALFVQFAMELDDGEAMSLALCCSRGYMLATDDRKARKIAARHPGISLLSTPEVIRQWSEQSKCSADELRHVLRAIEVRARFDPANEHPLRDWWSQSRR
jgi:predicted nucleic acid-binding protein